MVTPVAKAGATLPPTDAAVARSIWNIGLQPGEGPRLTAVDEDVSQVVQASKNGGAYMQFSVRDPYGLAPGGLRSTTVTAWVNGAKAVSSFEADEESGDTVEFSGVVLVGPPGDKVVKVALGGQEAETRFSFRPAPDLEWTNIVQDEALFQVADMAPSYVSRPWRGAPSIVDGAVTTTWITQSEGLAFRDLQWRTDFVDPQSIVVTLNGTSLDGLTPVAHVDGEVARGSVPARLFKAGLNTLEVTGVDAYGISRSAQRRFWAYPGNRIPEGAVLRIRLGLMGSKRGPAYAMNLKGPAFTSVKPVYYLESDRLHFAMVRAARVGDGELSVLQGYWRGVAKPEARSTVAHVKVKVVKF
jgi:hypothetical protein